MLMSSVPNLLTKQDVTGQRWSWNRKVLIIFLKVYQQ
jgi:hypothetical protein